MHTSRTLKAADVYFKAAFNTLASRAAASGAWLLARVCAAGRSFAAAYIIAPDRAIMRPMTSTPANLPPSRLTSPLLERAQV